MLEHAKLTLVGRHHSGLEDCRNIAKIVMKITEEEGEEHRDGGADDGALGEGVDDGGHPAEVHLRLEEGSDDDPDCEVDSDVYEVTEGRTHRLDKAVGFRAMGVRRSVCFFMSGGGRVFYGEG